MNEALENTEKGVVVGGNMLKDIKFADDDCKQRRGIAEADE